MDIGIISSRYAKALIDYAREKEEEDILYQELKRLTKSFRNFPQLRTVISNPILSVKEKVNLLTVAANGEAETSSVFTRFMKFVIKQRREIYLEFMCLNYINLYRSAKHIGVGTLITAVPVDDETKARIRKTAAKRLHAKMELQTIVDPDIIGGFVFDVNDYRIDASVVGKLKQIKQQFIDKNKRIV